MTRRGFITVYDPGEARLLTPQQVQVLGLLWDGLSQKDIARELNLSERRIHTVVEEARRKVQAKSTVHLLRLALERGMVTL